MTNVLCGRGTISFSGGVGAELVSFDLAGSDQWCQVELVSEGVVVDDAALSEWLKALASEQQTSCDEDGGMHSVGSEMLIGYEVGQFAVEDLYMPVAA